jgi:hypothetical protein
MIAQDFDFVALQMSLAIDAVLQPCIPYEVGAGHSMLYPRPKVQDLINVL